MGAAGDPHPSAAQFVRTAPVRGREGVGLMPASQGSAVARDLSGSAPVLQIHSGHRSGETQSSFAGVELPSLRQLVRERLDLSDEADPHVIAAGLVADLPSESLRKVILEGVLCVVTDVIRAERKSRPRSQDEPKSAKWENVAEAVAGNPDIFLRRYKTPAGWKFLGDFTKADAEWNRDQHIKLADAANQRAAAFDVLSKRLRPRGLLRDQLKAEQVEEIFSA